MGCKSGLCDSLDHINCTEKKNKPQTPRNLHHHTRMHYQDTSVHLNTKHFIRTQVFNSTALKKNEWKFSDVLQWPVNYRVTVNTHKNITFCLFWGTHDSLGSCILPSLPTEVSKLWRILPGWHKVSCDKIHHSSGTELCPFKQASNKLTFSLARFMKVFLISLLLATFPFTCLIHLFSSSSQKFLVYLRWLLHLSSSFYTTTRHSAAICVSFCIFWFYFPSSKISLPSLSNSPNENPVFSAKPRLGRSKSQVPVAQPISLHTKGCSLEHDQSHLPACHQGWWHRVYSWALPPLLNSSCHPSSLGSSRSTVLDWTTSINPMKLCLSKLLNQNC